MSNLRIDDLGGPAYPVQHESGQYFGLSARDYFAAEALPHALAYQLTGHEYYARVAAMCYELADAMLAERAK